MTKKIVDEFVVFSDHHAHNFKYASKRVTYSKLPGRYNSRLLDGARVLEEIKRYCEDNDISRVLFGGDLFHVREFIDVDVWNVVQEELKDFPKSWAIPGNHDFCDREGKIHSLEHLDRSNFIICDDVAKWPLSRNTSLFTVPYTDDPQVAKARLKKAGEMARDCADNHHRILLAHLGMQGAKVGSDFVMISQSDIEVDDVPYEDFTICLFGHYHQHQQLFPNGWFVGASHHHNWGDANTVRGFLHLKLYSDGSFDFKQIETSAPKFLVLDKSSTIEPRPEDFVKYYLDSEESEDEVKASINAADVRVVDPVEEAQEDLELESDYYLNPESMISAWVDARADGNESLKKLGKSLLSRAYQRGQL